MGKLTTVQKDGGKKMPEQKNEEKVTTAKADAIQKELLNILGRPPKFQRVKVHPIMANTYRVNVWCGEENHELIVHSYFMKFVDGSIVESNPKVIKVY